MADAGAGPPTSPCETDLDLYCLQCGYNLRGLSGDPRRCPECGHLNPVGDLEIPAPLIAARLRKMETAPALSAGGLLIGLPTLVALAVFLPGTRHLNEVLCCPGVPFLLAWALWLSGLWQFRTFCQGRAGWLSLFIEYQIYALVLCITVGGAVLVCSAFGRGEYILPGFLAACALIFVGGRWAHKRLRSKMEPLQREMAVRIARDELRRKLASPKGR